MQVDRPDVRRGESVLHVADLTYADDSGHQLLKHVSFKVYENEILGIAGVEGNGQTELAEVLTGLRPPTTGEAFINQEQILGRGPPFRARASSGAYPGRPPDQRRRLDLVDRRQT